MNYFMLLSILLSKKTDILEVSGETEKQRGQIAALSRARSLSRSVRSRSSRVSSPAC